MPSRAAERAAAIVLAAGESRRFGSPKLLMPWRGTTVIGSVVAALEEADLDPVIVVVGGNAAGIAAALAGTRACIVPNLNPERGMVSSVRVGVSALPPGVGRFVLALGDQPRVRPSDILRPLREHVRQGRGIAIPTYRGKRGHPVVFGGRYREEILSLGDGNTLRDLIHAHPDDIAEVECTSDAVLLDIDTPGQYEDELGRALPGRGADASR